MTEPVALSAGPPAQVRPGRARRPSSTSTATSRSALRERFVDEVQRITWAYKLADDTIHLRGTTRSARDPGVHGRREGRRRQRRRADRDRQGRARSRSSSRSLSEATGRPQTGWRRPQGSSTGGRRSRRLLLHRLAARGRTRAATADGARPARPLRGAAGAATAGRDARRRERLAEATARLSQARKLEREIAALERRAPNRAPAQPQGRTPRASSNERHAGRAHRADRPNADRLDKEDQWTS